MRSDIIKMVKECDICQKQKHETISPPGLLQPLAVPEVPWKDISMDFIEGLPNSHGSTTIWVIVDRLTKYGHFIPLKHPFTATEIA